MDRGGCVQIIADRDAHGVAERYAKCGSGNGVVEGPHRRVGPVDQGNDRLGGNEFDLDPVATTGGFGRVGAGELVLEVLRNASERSGHSIIAASTDRPTTATAPKA